MNNSIARAARVGVLAGVLVAAGGVWMLNAQAAGTNAGPATVVSPANNQPLSGGTKDTEFTLKLPVGAACSGDSANDGYRVQSYHVRSSVDPSSLTFDADGPLPHGFGAEFSQPLYKTDSNPYVEAQTAPATPAPGPGPVTNVPAFTFGFYDATTLPAGTYNIGIACTKGTASSTQLDKFWNAQVTFDASLNWTVATTSTTSTSSTSTSSTSSSTTSSTTSSSTTSTTTSSTTSSTTSTTALPPTSSTTSSTTSTTKPPASSTTSSTSTSTSTTSTTQAPGTTTSTTAPQGISVSSSTGAPGTTLTVKAGGYLPGSNAQVILRSDPVVLATAAADANGLVTASVTIPLNTPAGAHTIEVLGTGTNGQARSQTTAFTVSGALPRTGSDAAPLARWAAFMVLSGAAAAYVGRRRPLKHGLLRK